MPARPTFSEILELPSSFETSVLPPFIDANGHMNIRHYVDVGGAATNSICEDVGINDGYRGSRRMGVFTAEQHLAYFSEMHLGEAISAHVRVLDRSGTAVHMMAMILDRANDRLACTFETLLVHVNMDTRRPTPLPQDVAKRLDRHLASDRAIRWPAPVSGALGIRR